MKKEDDKINLKYNFNCSMHNSIPIRDHFCSKLKNLSKWIYFQVKQVFKPFMVVRLGFRDFYCDYKNMKLLDLVQYYYTNR